VAVSADRRAWIVVALGALGALALWNWRGTWNKPGATMEAAITLVTSDREDLSCGLDQAIGSLRCQYQTSGAPAAPPVDRRDRLAPYMTVSRQMLLVPALFDQPAIAARYQQEPPAGVPRQQLRRFVARCRLRLIDTVDSLMVRWVPGAAWSPASNAWVAQPTDCRVEN
jgi:hypothetical protein